MFLIVAEHQNPYPNTSFEFSTKPKETFSLGIKLPLNYSAFMGSD